MARNRKQIPVGAEAAQLLASLFSVANDITMELERDARALGELKEGDRFPLDRATELREKIVEAMIDWAARRMGVDLEKYLEEGKRNFLDLFKLNHLHFDPGGRMPREYERFWEPFEKTRFLIPLKFSRRIVPHSLWPEAWEIYQDVLPIFQKIKTETQRSKKAFLMAIKENLPGVPDDEAEKLWRMDKASDRAAEYARWKLKLPVGVEAIKEYFKVFHQPYGYFDFIAKNLIRQG
jgi:hypothetical protein